MLKAIDAEAGLSLARDEQRIRAAGCDGYIAKPLRYLEFLKVIADQFAAHAD